MKTIYVSFLTLLALIPAGFASNGSSGIGNPKLPLIDGVFVSSFQARFRMGAQGLERVADGALILRMRKLSGREATEARSIFRPALLGEVKAWEFIPDRVLGSFEENAWIVCADAGDCVRLEPARDAGIDAALAIGSLVK